MKLPDITTNKHEPSFEKGYTEVHFLKKPINGYENIGIVKLPKWLTNLIKDEIDTAYSQGKLEVKTSLRTLIGAK